MKRIFSLLAALSLLIAPPALAQGTLQQLNDATAAGFAAVGDTFSARVPVSGGNTISLKTPNGVPAFKVYSPDGVNQFFGSSQGFANTTTDGVRLGDFIWDGDNHYLTTRGYLAWKDDNPVNIGTYRANYTAGLLTKGLKYDSARIDWAISSQDGRMAPTAGGYGRSSQTGTILTEDRTNTAAGGVYYISATTTGTLLQPIAVYLHGTSQSFVTAGKAAQSINNPVDYPGYGAHTIYMVNTATQAGQSFRDVASVGRGVDYGWQTSNSRFYAYAVSGNNLFTAYSIDPADKHIRFGSNENAIDIDTVGNKVFLPALQSSTSYANDAAAAAGGVAVGQIYRNGSVVMIRVS